MKQFTSVNDVENIDELLKIALEIKANPFAQQEVGKNKTIGLTGRVTKNGKHI